MNQCSTGYHLEGELDSAEGAKALEGLAVTFSDGLPPNTRIGAPSELEETELDEEGNAVKAKKKAKSNKEKGLELLDLAVELIYILKIINY